MATRRNTHNQSRPTGQPYDASRPSRRRGGSRLVRRGGRDRDADRGFAEALGALPDLPADPTLAAAVIAQQQSAYSIDAYHRPGQTLPLRALPSTDASGPTAEPPNIRTAAPSSSSIAATLDDSTERRGKGLAGKKVDRGRHTTVIRTGGGKVWEDPTLLEWDPAHFRLYCGNLGGEVTDASLHAAFAAYPSLARARVVRDKSSGKSRGFGFVAFASADDVLAAWRAMNGRYVGSRPVQLRRAETDVRATEVSGRALERKQAKSLYERAMHGEKTSIHARQEQLQQHDRRQELQRQQAGEVSAKTARREHRDGERDSARTDAAAANPTTAFVPRTIRRR